MSIYEASCPGCGANIHISHNEQGSLGLRFVIPPRERTEIAIVPGLRSPGFDRTTYQRELMRKRRAAAKNKDSA